jgi:hypothetical protein
MIIDGYGWTRDGHFKVTLRIGSKDDQRYTANEIEQMLDRVRETCAELEGSPGVEVARQGLTCAIDLTYSRKAIRQMFRPATAEALAVCVTADVAEKLTDL